MDPLLTHDRDLVRGAVVDRPNRFVVRVRFDGEPERAFLDDPGALAVLQPDREVLCSPADDPERSTAYDAIAVDADGVYISLRAALANDLFAAAIQRGALPAFGAYSVREREPQLPDHGRADFLLDGPADEPASIEVKSCTHVEAGVGKFPDRQTERGRRQLRSLRELVESGREAHLVFVAQRPDAEVVRPFRDVDPEFADLLDAVRRVGVGVHAMSVRFDPPDYRLVAPDVPVESA